MRSLPWPCFLTDCLSPAWQPGDCVAELWTDSPTRGVQLDSTLSFASFTRLASDLAIHLKSVSKVGLPQLVGIIWQPHVLTVAAMHGILLAGSAFSPLTPTSWSNREKLLGAVVVLGYCSGNLKSSLERLQFNSCTSLQDDFHIWIRSNYLACTDTCRPVDRLAYCIKTSGSTGASKTVLVAHSCIAANVIDLHQRLGDSDGRFMNVLISSPLTFDASIVQIYLALLTRRRIVFPSERLLFGLNDVTIRELCVSARLSIWQCTPSVFRQLSHDSLSTIHDACESQITFLLGGEPCCPSTLPTRFPRFRFFIIYGVTEVSAWSSILEVTEGLHESPPIQGSTPIGGPMAFSEMCLNQIDESGIGQLYLTRIGGAGFSILKYDVDGGYAASFSKALAMLSENRWWPTGDFVMHVAENIHSPYWFIGRKDRMVKLFGRKCHLECVEIEIRRLLSKSVRILNCSSSLSSDGQTISTRVQIDCNTSISDSEKRELLTNIQSKFQVPQKVNLTYNNLPLTVNGKLAITTTTVRSICTSSLGLPNFDSHLTFLELGGSSLTAMHLVATLTENFPFLKHRKALLLSTLFTASFSEFVQLTETIPKTDCVIQPPFKKPYNALVDILDREACIWSHNLGKCVDASGLIAPAPVNAVFIGSHSGYFKRLDLETGHVCWSRLLTKGANNSPCRIEASATLVRAGLIAVGTLDGVLYGLDWADGAVLWQVETGGAIKASPTPIPNTPLLLTASHGRTVIAIDIDRPQHPVWEIVLDKAPVVAPIILFGVHFDALVASLAGNLHCINSKTGHLKWTTTSLGPVFGAPLVLQQPSSLIIVATADGRVHGVDGLSGGRRAWSITPSIRGFFASPHLLPNGHVLLGSQSGQMHVISIEECPGMSKKPSIETKVSVVWSRDFSQQPLRVNQSATFFLTTPCDLALGQSRDAILVCRTDGLLLACDFEGRARVLHTFPAETFSAPKVTRCIDNDKDAFMVVVGCRDDRVYGLKITAHDLEF